MEPGVLTFDVNRRLAAGGFAVSDDEVAEAMALRLLDLKLVVEPGGAVTLAALLTGRYDVRDRCVAITLSGGNIDPDLMARLLAES